METTQQTNSTQKRHIEIPECLENTIQETMIRYKLLLENSSKGIRNFSFKSIHPFQTFPIHVEKSREEGEFVKKTFYVVPSIVFPASMELKQHYTNRFNPEIPNEVVLNDMEPEHFELFLKWLYIQESKMDALEHMDIGIPALEPLDDKTAPILLFTASRFGVQKLVDIAAPFVAASEWKSFLFCKHNLSYPPRVEEHVLTIAEQHLNMFAVKEVANEIKDLQICKKLLHMSTSKFYVLVCNLLNWMDQLVIQLNECFDDVGDVDGYDIKQIVLGMKTAKKDFGSTIMDEKDIFQPLSDRDFQLTDDNIEEIDSDMDRDAALKFLATTPSPLDIVEKKNSFPIEDDNIKTYYKLYEYLDFQVKGLQLPPDTARLVNNNKIFHDEQIFPMVKKHSYNKKRILHEVETDDDSDDIKHKKPCTTEKP